MSWTCYTVKMNLDKICLSGHDKDDVTVLRESERY